MPRFRNCTCGRLVADPAEDDRCTRCAAPICPACEYVEDGNAFCRACARALFGADAPYPPELDSGTDP